MAFNIFDQAKQLEDVPLSVRVVPFELFKSIQKSIEVWVMAPVQFGPGKSNFWAIKFGERRELTEPRAEIAVTRCEQSLKQSKEFHNGTDVFPTGDNRWSFCVRLIR